jgi:formylglycine-generating enzyme
MSHLSLFHTFLFTIVLCSCVPTKQAPISIESTATSQLQPTAVPQPTAISAATQTPRMGSTQVSPKDGMVMVFVPAGEFEMGGYGERNQAPVHTVYLDAFWIDRTEVTNAMFAEFIKANGYVTDAEKIGGSYVYRATDQGDYTELVKGPAWNNPLWEYSDFADLQHHPVVHVSWNDAQAYCSWVERRLPAEAEWE